MATVYIVTDGEYSDYGIVGVFSTRELADTCAKNLIKSKWSNAKVETWNLDPHVDELRQGLAPWTVTMDRDGNSDAIIDAGSLDSKEDERHDWSGKYTFYVWAEDEQHAVKIANERRAQIVAAGNWPTRTVTTR